MGLEVAGVDMLQGKDGPKILEINSSPGLEGIERTSGVDVAGAIMTYAERFRLRKKQSKSKARSNGRRTDTVLDEERRERRMRPAGGSTARTARGAGRAVLLADGAPASAVW